MWPSICRGTRAGSQFGIWLATAVIRPNVNDVTPRSARMRRMTASRSLRILRRPAPALRLRLNKRRTLALSAAPDDDERCLGGGVGATGLLPRHQHGRRLADRL